MITLIQLEYLLAVDRHRHFVTAAEKCFVTQPTLSMQIKKLEEHLGVIIFDRSKQPVIPTEIGKRIIEQARATVNAAKEIPELIKEHNQSVSGTLNIGIIPSLAPYLLPKFIGSFTKSYPGVQVKIVELLSEEMILELQRDLIDVGILVTPLHEKGIIEKPLFYEKMMLYTHDSHPFARKKSVKPEDIMQPDIWLLSKGHCFRSQVINLCSYKSNVQEKFPFEYESGSLETLKRFVETEGGFTLLPELSVNAQSTSSGRILPFSAPIPVREVSLIHSRNFAKKRLIELLENEIVQSIPDEMKDPKRGHIVQWR